MWKQSRDLGERGGGGEGRRLPNLAIPTRTHQDTPPPPAQSSRPVIPPISTRHPTHGWPWPGLVSSCERAGCWDNGTNSSGKASRTGSSSPHPNQPTPPYHGSPPPRPPPALLYPRAGPTQVGCDVWCINIPPPMCSLLPVPPHPASSPARTTTFANACPLALPGLPRPA